MNNKQLSTFFLKNRAEQLPDDLWGRYVLPLKYNSYNLLERNKSTHIVGGRGTGKTMYLKYHCFPTILSKEKELIRKETLQRIGIYWRPDSSFTALINEDYIGQNWIGIFNTYIGLSLLSELSKFIITLSESNYEDPSLKNELNNIIIEADKLEFLNIKEDTKFIDLDEKCKYLRSSLDDWLNYPVDKPPVVFGAKEKILYFINYIIKQVKPLKDTNFFVYIDEFENFSDEQQEILNAWMKHSSEPLIFNVAYKKYYNSHNRTSARERITCVHDYEIIDLESEVYHNFHIFSAEIILNKIQNFYKQELKIDYKLIEYNLSNIEHLEKRNSPKYQKGIIQIIRKILPTYKFNELSEKAIRDKEIFYKIRRLVSPILKDTAYSIKDFVSLKNPKESITHAILLNRKNYREDPSKLLQLIKSGNAQYKNSINNTFLGALLYLYISYSDKTCPYYGGFNRFVVMSKNNVRHLLELCHKSFIEYESKNFPFPEFDKLSIPPEIQAIAAKNVSQFELNRKVPDLSNLGSGLKKIIERLGEIYILAQKQNSQSEPEKNHFSIIGKDLENNEDIELEKLIYEAKLWSIIIPKTNTKKKDVYDNSSTEYHLHPIFAPYFGISPRHKRKFEFSFEEIETIFVKDSDEFEKMYKKYIKKFEDDNNTRNKEEINLMDFI